MPCGPIYSIDQMYADPHVQQLGVTGTSQSAKLGPLEVNAQPGVLTRTPSEIAAAAPERGEHSDEILERFGYNAEEIAAFRKSNVV